MRPPASALSARAIAIAIALAPILASCGGAAPRTATPAAATAPASVTTVATAPPPLAFPRTEVAIVTASGTRRIGVEVAATPAQSERGLGYRDALAADAGMLFDLGSTRVQPFWMKGMRFALDMVWIGADRRVAAVTADVQAQPGAPDASLRLYAPPVPVRYVLEVNAGAAARLGIAAGTQLSFTLP